MKELFRMNDHGDVWQEPDLFDAIVAERCQRCSADVVTETGILASWPYCPRCDADE